MQARTTRTCISDHLEERLTAIARKGFDTIQPVTAMLNMSSTKPASIQAS